MKRVSLNTKRELSNNTINEDMLEIIIKMLKYNLYEFKLMDSDDLLEVDVELFFGSSCSLSSSTSTRRPF